MANLTYCDFGENDEGSVFHAAELTVRVRYKKDSTVSTGAHWDACALHDLEAYSTAMRHAREHPDHPELGDFVDIMTEFLPAVGGEDTRGG